MYGCDGDRVRMRSVTEESYVIDSYLFSEKSRTSSIPSRSSNKAQKESAWLGQSRCNSSRDIFCGYWGS